MSARRTKPKRPSTGRSPPVGRSQTIERFRHATRDALTAAGDPGAAVQQQAYMKSAMPFAGVKVPEMRRIAKALIAAHPLDAGTLWRDGVIGLWNGAEFREERYVAIELFLAKRYAPLRNFDAAAIAEHMIVTGAWWDLVDSVAPPFLGELLLNDPTRTVPLLVAWSRDDDMWKRRAALIAQLRLKKRTDEKLLFALIAPSLASTEFFLRKAIGWALREYSKTAPESVADYVQKHASRLSPLSRREATKIIGSMAPPSRSA